MSIWDWLFGQKCESQTTGHQAICIHQREKPVYEPEPEAWTAMQIRRAQERSRPPRHTGAMTPIPRTPTTGEIPQIAAPVRKAGHDPRDWSEVPTARKLPLHDLLDDLPGHALPVRREPAVSSLTTVRANRESKPVPAAPDLSLAGLPTWLSPATIDKLVADALPPMLPEPKPYGYEWINSSNVAEIEVWGEPETAESAFDALMRHDSSTLSLPSVTEQIAAKHKKESE